MIRTWRFDSGGQTIALASQDDGLPEAIWWGPSLPEHEDLEALAEAAAYDITGGTLDLNPSLSLCPLATDGWQGQSGLVAWRDGERLAPLFRMVEHHRFLKAVDPELGLTLTIMIEPSEHGTIVAQCHLEAARPITLHWLAAPVLPGPQEGDILDFHGRWIGEFQPVRTGWSPGIRMREAVTGRSGHEHPPLAYFPGEGATNTRGPVWAMHLGWSGGHRMLAEELPDGRRQIQMGKAAGSLGTGTSFHSGALTLAWSDSGLNGCATAFQRAIRDAVPWPDRSRPRPVHYNCWEAVYFDHNLQTLQDIATRAADLGAERFVLDDGWFGRRDDERSSLGDWTVDRRKWPNGLHPLIDHVKSLGMTFGLWVEPEMINPDSDLYRAHPDWALGSADQILGRHQMVLDMAREEVRDHLFAVLDALLSEYDIDYLKWDHNRLLPVSDARQTDGVWDLLHRIAEAHDVEIESCASGGGRIDAGILMLTHRVWLSDSNDALERLRIQHDAALLLPAGVTGSHVGPRRCHTSGRVLDMSFRAWVAAQRHMGFEMDPRELTEDEAETLKSTTAWWKTNRDWMMAGDILRLDSADASLIAEQQLSRDGGRFVVFAGKAATSAQIAPRPLRLTRLDPDARYRVELLNRADSPGLSRGKPALKEGPAILSGTYLMHHGLTLPWSFPETMWVVEGTRL